MIKCVDVTKKFDKVTALEQLTCNIPEGCIYGLVGANGAGKSTLLRLITGIYSPDVGDITIDGMPVVKKDFAKSLFVFVPDELFFLPGANMKEMARFYSEIYPTFFYGCYERLINEFSLNPTVNISTFSKGMKRQAATVLALSCQTKYMFFDETFDGLDPLKRSLLKKIIHEDVKERESTVVITSHSLRELEDTCNQLALLHKGGLIFESEVQNLKTSLFKIQIGLNQWFDQTIFKGIEIMQYKQNGSVANMIIKGDKEQAVAKMQELQPQLLDVLPLSLEEVVVFEMEVLGLDKEVLV